MRALNDRYIALFVLFLGALINYFQLITIGKIAELIVDLEFLQVKTHCTTYVLSLMYIRLFVSLLYVILSLGLSISALYHTLVCVDMYARIKMCLLLDVF